MRQLRRGYPTGRQGVSGMRRRRTHRLARSVAIRWAGTPRQRVRRGSRRSSASTVPAQGQRHRLVLVGHRPPPGSPRPRRPLAHVRRVAHGINGTTRKLCLFPALLPQSWHQHSRTCFCARSCSGLSRRAADDGNCGFVALLVRAGGLTARRIPPLTRRATRPSRFFATFAVSPLRLRRSRSRCFVVPPAFCSISAFQHFSVSAFGLSHVVSCQETSAKIAGPLEPSP